MKDEVLSRRAFRGDCEFFFPSMAAVNRHRRETGFRGTMINDDLEEGDSDFTTHYNYPVKVDSTCIINILGLLKQAVFINANKN